MKRVPRMVSRAAGVWAIAGATVGSVGGAPSTWTGINLGKAFNEPSNWSPNGMPGVLDNPTFKISDTVLFTSNPTNANAFVGGGAGTSSVFMSESGDDRTWSLDSLGVSQLGRLSLNGPDVNVQFATHVQDSGTLVINAGSRLTSRGVSTEPIINNTFNSMGTITVNGGALETTNQLEIGGGTPVKSGSGVLAFTGGVGTFAGAVDMAESGIGVQALMTLTNGALVTHTQGSVFGSLRLATRDDGNLSAATLSISGGAKYRAPGFATEVGSTLKGKGTISIGAGGWFEGFAGLNINPLGVVIVDGGTLSGMTSVNVNGGSLVYTSGTISPTVGIHVEGGGTFAAASRFEVAPGTRLRIVSGLGTFANGLNAGINASGTIDTTSGIISAGSGTSVWGSGTTGLAIASLGGSHTVGTLLVGANGGAATVTIHNGGRLDVNGGLVVGDNLGTNSARVVVSGPVGTLSMGTFVPTVINRRGSIVLLSNAIYKSGGSMDVNGGLFDATAGFYDFTAPGYSLTVRNGGTFQGSSFSSPTQSAPIEVNSGGQLLLSGTLAISGESLIVSDAGSLVHANAMSMRSSTMTILNNAVGSFTTVSLPYEFLGSATLTVSSGCTLRVANSMDVAFTNAFTTFGNGSISGSLTNRGDVRVGGGSLTVDGGTTNNGTIVFDSSSGVTANFADIDGDVGQFLCFGLATITFNRLRQASLIGFGRSRLTTRVNGGPSGVSRVASLNFGNNEPDTYWNLNDNDLVVDYASGGPSPAAYVRQLLRSGRHGGAWDGPGLSSAIAAADSRKALGYADNGTLGKSTFSGQSVDPTSVLIKFTWCGDADLDGDADGVDIGRWATNFTGELSGGLGATLVWTQGDWDYDGDVDGVDAGFWATAFTGELSGGGLTIQLSTALAPEAETILFGLGVTAVPEPVEMLALSAARALALRRRKPTPVLN